MKHSISFLTILLGLCFSCKDSKSQKIFFDLKNNLKIKRTSELVLINRTDFQKKWNKKTETTHFLILDEKENEIPFQLDDLNLDGKWDQLAFTLDFQPQQTRRIYCKKIEKNPVYKASTNVRLGKDAESNGSFEDLKAEKRDPNHKPQAVPVLYQMEGIAWENDKVGFRHYFDDRNGKDIFGKRTEKLVLDKCGLVADNYHSLADWGMDILKVGPSLGAGALALVDADGLHRLGKTDDSHFRLIAEGPARAIFEIRYEGWRIGEKSYSLTERISLAKGNHFYKNEVFVEGDEKARTLASGLVNLHYDGQPKNTKTDAHELLYTHGKQSENHDMLGLGLLVPLTSSLGTGITSNTSGDIRNTFFIKMKNKARKASTYYCFAAWELADKKFAKENPFLEYMKECSLRLANPIQAR
ncbi:MAG: DUF4861 domain-containing protein [Cytophagales bacterium]|nr:DUF4861 domain-containing protein [Cytophagales bacterium]